MSYADRFRRLKRVLDPLDRPQGLQAQEGQGGEHEERCAKLDFVLLQYWAGRTSPQSDAVLQAHVQASDFDQLGKIGQGQYGSVRPVSCPLCFEVTLTPGRRCQVEV